MTATPNHALQRAAPCVTAPASTTAFPPTAQVPRRTPLSLSLGSLRVELHVVKKSWAHEDLSRKQIKKYAATLSEDEVRAVVEADIRDGLVPVIVGEDLETCSRLGISDNEVSGQFEIMGEMNDDSVWYFAVTKYVFEHDFQRFASVVELQAHVRQLTAAKYGNAKSDHET